MPAQLTFTPTRSTPSSQPSQLGEPSRLPRAARVTAVLAAGTLAAAGLAVFPQPAAAAGCSGDPVVRTWREPERLALGISKTKTVDLIAATRKDCAVTTLKVTVSTRVVEDTFALTKYAGNATTDFWGATYEIKPKTVVNVEAGAWQTSYALTGPFGKRTHASSAFHVLRASRLTTNAGPEPVRKGATLTVTGTLSRANWETRRYAGYADQKVELQWRSPKGKYSKVKSVTGRSNGTIRTTVKAGKDGCYRFAFAGTSTTYKVTSVGDCVDVRG